MADFTLDNVDVAPNAQYIQYDVPQVSTIEQTFTGDSITIVTSINGASGGKITFEGSAIGVAFTGSQGGVVTMSISNAALFRTSISAAASGVNSDITQLLGASQVDVSSHYEVNGTQVLTAQQPAIPNAVLGTEVATINLILAALRTMGIIDT